MSRKNSFGYSGAEADSNTHQFARIMSEKNYFTLKQFKAGCSSYFI